MVEFNTSEDFFLIQHTDFSLREQLVYPNGGTSRFYDNGVDMVIIDDNICEHTYLVRTRDKKFAVEENGVTYHHPQIIGALRYKNQLRKQNTCALWGIKLFRFSTEDCR